MNKSENAEVVASHELLASTVEIHDRRLKVLKWMPGPNDNPKQPMDFGGYNGSHHSNDARAMAKKGYVENLEGGGWSRGSRRYRRSQKGEEYLKANA